MNIFGIGPLEFLLILVIALIIMGPNDMAKAGRSLGKFMRRVVTSPEWRTLLQASREMRNLPNRMMREAGIEDIKKDLPTPEQIIKESGLTEAVQDVNKELIEIKEASSWSNPIIDNPEEPEPKPVSEPTAAPENPIPDKP
jgi:sec-independent protein translocase protein TatB